MMRAPDDGRVRVRLDQGALSVQLDALDRQSAENNRPELRRDPRFVYRISDLTVEMQQRSGLWKAYACPTRNLSAQGISLIVPHFVYTGTAIRVGLVSLQNRRVTQLGRVVACGYVLGSAGLHEVHVAFDSAINVGLFHQGAVPTRVLLADSDAGVRKLVPALLRDEPVSLTAVETADAALAALEKDEFHLALLGLDPEGVDGRKLAQTLRSRGFSLPLIAIAAPGEGGATDAAREAGFDAWVSKPLTQIGLVSAVQSLRSEPIFSTLVHECDMLELVNAFVDELHDRVRELQTALGAGDVPALAKLVNRLGLDARAYGFDTISTGAEGVVRGLSSAALDSVDADVRRLIRMCQAATGVSKAAPPPSS